MRLRVTSFGTDCEGIELKGDKHHPEPDHARIALPGGDVDVVRCDDGSYWVHIRVDLPDDGDDPHREFASITDGRLDILGRHTSEVDRGEIDNPDLYHLAVRIKHGA